MSRRNRRPNASPRPPVSASAHAPAVTTEPPRLQVRRLSLALGTLAGAALSLPLAAPALTLGDIAIGSTLGQPLQARIPVQLAPGETAGPDCIASLRPGTAALAAPAGTKLQLGKALAGKLDLQITTARPLYEPMYGIDLALRCPGGATIVRQYVLMLDLPTATSPAASTATGTFGVTPAPAPSLESPDGHGSPSADPAMAGAKSVRPSTALASGSAYEVQPGDTLSTIAERVRDRGGLNIWQLAARIFAENPQAFIGADPDRIRLGAQIMLPAPLEAAAPRTETAASQAAPDTHPEAVAAPAPVTQDQAPQENTTADPQAATAAAAASTAAAAPPAKAAPRKPDRTRAAALRKPAPKKREPQHTTQDTAGYQAPAWQAILLGALIGALASAALLRERLRDTVSALGRRWRRTASSRPAPVKVVAASPPLPVSDRQHQVSAMVVEESPPEVPADDFAVAVATADTRAHHLDDTVESPAAKASEAEDSIWQPAEAFEFNTLAHHTDEEQSAPTTLQEVLELLESDYEQELTASQVLDRSRFTVDVDELPDAHDDDTLVRAMKRSARG